MDFLKEYERIRPYNDSEVSEAISRLLKDERFENVIAFLYGENNIQKVINEIKEIKTINGFQDVFSHYAVREVIRKTSGGLSFSGLNELDPNKSYLFIANHRDIVLDSAIMQILLVENNHKTSQITFGSNLMSSDFVVDLGKLNKMFTFARGGSRIQMYKNALLHSEYIKTVITKKKESIWISQRDGRTKDGNDKTQLSLLKMLLMGKDDPYIALKELNIVPVSISYEYEPCDSEKVQEQYITNHGKYIKEKNEDLNSVLKGITSNKGKIHMAFGNTLNSEILTCENEGVQVNEMLEQLTNSIDKQIYENYKLNPLNYIALDLLNNSVGYLGDKYEEADIVRFKDYVLNKSSLLKGNVEELKIDFYKMYANPLKNKHV